MFPNLSRGTALAQEALANGVRGGENVLVGRPDLGVSRGLPAQSCWSAFRVIGEVSAMQLSRLASVAALSLILCRCGTVPTSDARPDQARLALEAAQAIRLLLNDGDCNAVYALGDTSFHQKVSKEDWLLTCRNSSDSRPWSDVVSRKVTRLRGSDWLAVKDSFRSSSSNSRTLITLWKLTGKSAKLHALMYLENSAAVIEVPQGGTKSLAKSSTNRRYFALG
jgi:hypothetical protein